jgi:hypothetical protein
VKRWETSEKFPEIAALIACFANRKKAFRQKADKGRMQAGLMSKKSPSERNEFLFSKQLYWVIIESLCWFKILFKK